MTALTKTRRVTSFALSSAALALLGAGRVTKWAADRVRPGTVTADDVAATYEQRGRVKTPPQEPVAAPAEPQVSHARASESHIEELAALPATELVAAIEGLSTDELRLLLEHEQSHRRRKAVLDAIERAATQHTS